MTDLDSSSASDHRIGRWTAMSGKYGTKKQDISSGPVNIPTLNYALCFNRNGNPFSSAWEKYRKWISSERSKPDTDPPTPIDVKRRRGPLKFVVPPSIQLPDFQSGILILYWKYLQCAELGHEKGIHSLRRLARPCYHTKGKDHIMQKGKCAWSSITALFNGPPFIFFICTNT